MASIASATALNGHSSTPLMMDRDLAWRPTEIAISVAPPSGDQRNRLKRALRATDMASVRIVSVLGVVHSVRNVKYLQGVS